MAELSDEHSDRNDQSDGANFKKAVQTRDLIAMVKRHGCLWDRRHESYRNKFVKSKAWKDIYREIEPAYNSLSATMRHQIGVYITKKWYNVRDSYVKSKRSRNSRPYIYTDDMTFLDAVIKCDEQRECTTGNESEEGDNWMSEVFIDVDEGKEEIPSKRPKYDVLNLAKEDQTVLDESLNDSNMVTFLANLIHKEEDEDRAFFKSITPAVKTLSQDAKLEFRIMVMKILKGLKKKQGLVKREPSTYSDSE